MQAVFNAIKTWLGPVEIDGTLYDSVNSVGNVLNDIKNIKLLHAEKSASKSVEEATDKRLYKITVKRYMTRKASPEFDFMLRFNNDEPMPYRTMIGTIEKETRGMVYMDLHADIYADRIYSCMKCGKRLTNPVSQYFGIGPECGGHNYIHPFDTDEELKDAVDKYKKQLQSVQWRGWIIKSAIMEQEEVSDDSG